MLTAQVIRLRPVGPRCPRTERHMDETTELLPGPIEIADMAMVS
jgi:hypothetical protein